MTLILIAILVFIKVLQFFLIDSVSLEYQWLTWDVILLVIPIMLAVSMFREMSYKRGKDKMGLLLFILVSSWMLADYLILTLFENSINIEFIRDIMGGAFLLIFLPLTLNIIMRPNIDGDKYTPNDCYLAYRNPRNIFGLFASLIEFPYGQTALVVKGNIFRFKKGVLVEEKHAYPDKYLYKAVSHVPLRNARTLLGTKWSLKNNCFLIFNRFK